MPPHRILVCGTNYGRAYVEAVRSLPEKCELVGLLARGSERSRRLARELDVPLYMDLREVPGTIERACVAVPSSETGLIPALLRRGIHVLTDHPVASTTLATAIDTAGSKGLTLHLNPHFSHLDAPQAFIQASRDMVGSAAPIFVDVFTADRFLYGALDILRQALGALEPLSLRPAPAGPPVYALHGTLGGIPGSLQAQHAGGKSAGGLPDGSPEYFADIRISLTFPMGALTLLSVSGPVLWTWSFSRGISQDDALVPTTVHPGASMASLREQREVANRGAIVRWLEQNGTHDPPPEQEPDYLLEVIRSWEALGEAFPW